MGKVITNVLDLRELARRRVPRAFFEYADRGSYDEITLRDNRQALEAIRLRQRVMVDVDQRNLATTILAEPASMPLAIAPTGLTGLQWGGGEILGARAASAAGIPFCLSTMSICSIEQVRAAVDKPFWFQLYVMRDRGFTRSLIERAKAANCSALMLTLDLQIQGQRHREIKNGLTVPPKLTFANFFDIASKPAWLWRVLRAPSRSFGNLAGQIGGADSVLTLAQWIAQQFDPTCRGATSNGSAASGGQADRQGYSRRGGRRHALKAAWTQSSCPTMAAASWTARLPRSLRYPAWSTPWPDAARRFLTAAS